MKIHIIIIFFSVILGASCEKSESQRVNYGSILLESIHFSVGGETIPCPVPWMQVCRFRSDRMVFC